MANNEIIAGAVRHNVKSMTHQYVDNLKSERLVTRFLSEGDVQFWAGFFKHKEAVEHFLPSHLTNHEERAKEWIDKQLDRYTNNRFGLQAILFQETNEFIGQCGLLAKEVDGVSEIEVGYFILHNYWGQGFAPEAARLFIDYAFNNNLTKSIISLIGNCNVKSQRVAEKNGLIRERETNWLGLDVYIYRIERDEWEQSCA